MARASAGSRLGRGATEVIPEPVAAPSSWLPVARLVALALLVLEVVAPSPALREHAASTASAATRHTAPKWEAACLSS